MPKKKTPEEKPEDQFKRFVNTAKEHGVDEKEAEREFKKLSPNHSSSSSRGKKPG
jgi:hypothetical protein